MKHGLLAAFWVFVGAGCASGSMGGGPQGNNPDEKIDANPTTKDGPPSVDGASDAKVDANADANIDAPTVPDAPVVADASPDAGIDTLYNGPCDNYYDCTSPTFPVCSLGSFTCTVGYSQCTGSDDATENADDGLNYAIPVHVAGSTPIALVANLCGVPVGSELDNYRVYVPGGAVAIELKAMTGGHQFRANVYKENATLDAHTYIGSEESQGAGETIFDEGPGVYGLSVWRKTPSTAATSQYQLIVRNIAP